MLGRYKMYVFVFKLVLFGYVEFYNLFFEYLFSEEEVGLVLGWGFVF